MTFFPVPDEFYRDLTYLGWSAAEYALWVIAGSWSADRLTDGSVPATALALFPSFASEAADSLVARGVWKRTRGGGYQYATWPRECSREVVLAKREKERLKKANQRSVGDNPSSRAVESTGDTTGDKRGTPQGSPDPSSKPVKPDTQRGSLRSPLEGFDDFWVIYPRKKSKADARAAWVKAVKRHDRAEIIAGAKRFADERRGQDPEYTAYPATWLNGERWNDEPAQPRLSVVNGHQPYHDPDPSTYHEDWT